MTDFEVGWRPPARPDPPAPVGAGEALPAYLGPVPSAPTDSFPETGAEHEGAAIQAALTDPAGDGPGPGPAPPPPEGQTDVQPDPAERPDGWWEPPAPPLDPEPAGGEAADPAPVPEGTVAEPVPVAEPAPVGEPAAVLERALADPPEAGPEPVAPASPPGPVRYQARPLPRTIAIANQKGGVGKTTTAVNLGAALADLGYRVLVVDLDPQGNATTGLGINARNLTASIYDVLMSETPMEDCVEPTDVRNLFVAPATIDLAGAEIELVPAFSRELRLRRAIERLGDDYDFVLVDCPPSLGLITINGLAAVAEILVPIQCEYYALEGLGQLMRNVGLVQSNLNPRLELSTIVLTMYDARTKLADQVVKEVRSHFGAKVCRNVVPRTVRLSEAPSFGQPISVFDPTSRGAIAYRELAKEVSGGAPRRSG
ncbi:MAG: AAA family ATPase [Acidimicrobiales bacterium]